ncbi:MAG: SUF system NifU family Fe-S cluster assembly protein [Bacteroidia bacterium]|nr:SUF system NifU family Fe-S cluster assembly protein [Bacteroidia bacterium]MDW8134043.1 SUF system NifU family Fe-S cluster assembly protein [Bacteroidia bacterium]
MNAELQRLYQDLILEHNRYPRNYGRIENPTHEGEGHNPLCGDRIFITLRVQESRIQDIKFEGESCAICKASSSIMTTLVKGAPLEEVDKLFLAFHELLTQEAVCHIHGLPAASQEKLRIFATVRHFPIRVKCATLPWHTLKAVLNDPIRKVVSTE